MKKSSLLHWSGGILGVWGALSLAGAWLAGEDGTVVGLTQQHLYNDAIVITLLSISALICALIYLKQEKNK